VKPPVGYDGVAWERVCERTVLAGDRASTMELVDLASLPRSQALRGAAAGGGSGGATKPAPPFRQLRRLTLVVDAQSQLHRVAPTNEAVAGYDIVAVRPADEKMFTLCCSHPDIDAISLDLARPLGFIVKMVPALQAVRRGCWLEIRYAALTEAYVAEGFFCLFVCLFGVLPLDPHHHHWAKDFHPSAR
jgi:hypothetical protein